MVGDESSSLLSTAAINTAPESMPDGLPPPQPAPIQPHAMSKRDQHLVKPPIGSFAWTDTQWRARCGGVRTSYNPDCDVREDEPTLVPSDSRWLDFVFWTLSRKVNEHQVEAYGGTGWKGPKGGILFHWAPGSRWERDTLHSFGYFLGHVIGEADEDGVRPAPS